ncbi:hypothetical protein H632_c3029p1 [Helicosporidium sp. ATCC 50920]|nr:hypothetical protein H632_c3029p1 [Helicosporidium sp. ATCC 50920]|eukprot:KDD72684.1 hypothetical protein H632_c3029p1 [Helicosporidium sp. ATCC 50920]
MVAPQDYDALLLFKLRECLRESRRAEALTGKLAGDARNYAVDAAALEQRARELDLHDLGPFFKSEAFRQAGFALSDDAKTILLAR